MQKLFGGKTDLTTVYETRKNSQVRHGLTYHSLRMHFCLYSLLCKRNFQNHLLIFRKCKFSKFCKSFKFPKILNVLLLFCYCHDADHMHNEHSLNIFIGNHFFPNAAILQYWPQTFCIIIHIREFAAKSIIGIKQT